MSLERTYRFRVAFDLYNASPPTLWPRYRWRFQRSRKRRILFENVSLLSTNSRYDDDDVKGFRSPIVGTGYCADTLNRPLIEGVLGQRRGYSKEVPALQPLFGTTSRRNWCPSFPQAGRYSAATCSDFCAKHAMRCHLKVGLRIYPNLSVLALLWGQTPHVASSGHPARWRCYKCANLSNALDRTVGHLINT